MCCTISKSRKNNLQIPELDLTLTYPNPNPKPSQIAQHNLKIV